jgi:hypothetical protein
MSKFVWVVNWYELVAEQVWKWKRMTFEDKFEANLFADYIVSSSYRPKVRDVYIEQH